MKQYTTLILFCLCGLSSFAQQIPNGGFEQWTDQLLYEQPGPWNTGNFQDAATVTTSKVTGAPEGQFAAHLETEVADGDTAFGFVLLGGYDEVPEFGVPFGTDVDALECWLRYALQPGDTSLAIVVCWSGGVVSSFGAWRFHGQQTTWTQLTLPLPVAATNVDSVLVGFASTDALSETLASVPGSWMEVDHVRLTHPSVSTPDQLPNEGFEDWTDVTAEDPDGWTSFNARIAAFDAISVEKSTDANSGSFSAKLTTLGIMGDTLPGILANGILNNDGPYAGIPYAAAPMTFTGAYKYEPAGNDQCTIGATFIANGSPVGSASFTTILATNGWLPFSAAVNLSGGPPDTLLVVAFSGDKPGSTLWVDDLDLSGGDVSITDVMSEQALPWPNPADRVLHLPDVLPGDELRLLDQAGRVLLFHRSPQTGVIDLGLAEVGQGTYVLEVHREGRSIFHRVVIASSQP
ncbi:MAG: hypothetical protein KDB88_13565 [Flavobacteriales bacterium]|nr:hypothetical protein [Flavobacteriales bacterium]